MWGRASLSETGLMFVAIEKIDGVSKSPRRSGRPMPARRRPKSGNDEVELFRTKDLERRHSRVAAIDSNGSTATMRSTNGMARNFSGSAVEIQNSRLLFDSSGHSKANILLTGFGPDVNFQVVPRPEFKIFQDRL